MPGMISFGAYNESDIWFKAANELGYKVFVVSTVLKKDDPIYEKVSPYIEKIFDSEFSDLESIFRFCAENDISTSLCLPCPNSALIWQARLNTMLNGRGLQKKTAENCCDKLYFHSLLEKYDLPRPDKTLPAQLENAKKFDLPFIAKPRLGAGGIEVSKISSEEDLKNFFSKQSGELRRGKFNDFIFQSFVKADYHIGLNCVVKNKKLIIMAFNVRNLGDEKWSSFFTENIFPSDETDFLSKENLSILQKLIDVIELDNWPLKIEVFADSNKRIISFIEVNLRPGGTRSPIAFSKILGYDYALEQVKLCSRNHEASFMANKIPNAKYLLIKNLRFQPGQVSKIQWFQPRDNIISFLSSLQPGTIIPSHWDVTVAQMCGELILVGDNVSELKKICREIESEIQIEYYP